MRIVKSFSMLTALLCLWLLPGQAFAVVQFCNEFNHTTFFSIAYEQRDPKSDDNWFLSRGWLTVNQGECQYFDTALTVPVLYYRVETDPYLMGKRRGRMVWPADGGGARKFWVQDDTFEYYDSENANQRPSKAARYVDFNSTFTANDGDIWEKVTIGADGTISQSVGPDSDKPGSQANSNATPTPTPTPDDQANSKPKTAPLDADTQAIADRFRNLAKDSSWFDLINAKFMSDVINESPGPAQARLTYRLHNADASISTNLSLLIFPNENAAKDYIGTPDGGGHYAPELQRGELRNFGHISHDHLPSGTALYGSSIDQKSKRLSLYCATQIGRSVLVTATLEPQGNAIYGQDPPNDELGEGFFPLLVGVDALTGQTAPDLQDNSPRPEPPRDNRSNGDGGNTPAGPRASAGSGPGH